MKQPMSMSGEGPGSAEAGASSAPANGTTLLAIPGMCCAAEFGMVDKELRRIAGVLDVTPDYIRGSVCVQHHAVPDSELVSAAARSGFDVHVADVPKPPSRGRALSGIAIRAVGPCSASLEQRLNALEDQGKTAIVLVRDQVALAIFAIADAVRPESAQAIAELRRLGNRPVMLTGDNPHTAQAIACQVGIADVRSELLPEEELEAIEALSSGGTVVGMVGDGINDAPPSPGPTSASRWAPPAAIRPSKRPTLHR